MAKVTLVWGRRVWPMRMALAAAMAALLCFAVAGCAAKDSGNPVVRTESNASVDPATLAASTVPNEFAVYHVVVPDADGKVRIPTEGIGEAVSFFNIDVEGTTVQVFALRDSYGKVHVAFNTCQSCTPSPKAYYVQIQGILRCDACGFTFEANQVGAVAGGCNPWPIPGVNVTADGIVIPYASVAELADEFAHWDGALK